MDSSSTRTLQGWRLLFVAPVFILFASPLVAQVNGNAVLDARIGNVTIPHSAPLDLAPQLTIEAWVKLAMPTHAYGAVIDKGFKAGFSLGIQSLTGRTDSVDLTLVFSNYQAWKPRVALDTLTWMHLALSIDTIAHRYALYVNGAEVRSAAFAGVRFVNNNVDLRIGASAYGDQFSGLLDEIRIWNVIRSASEIAALWKHEAKGNEPGLVAVYHFEDERDTAAWNRAGSGGLHGTFSAKKPIVLVERPDAFINENESNRCFAAATPVNYESRLLEASIAPADTDYFKVWTWPGDVFMVESRAKNAGDSGDMKISMYGSDSVTAITSHSGGYPGFYSAASVPGYRYIQVVNRSGAGGSYTLQVHYTGETIVSDEYEPNNTKAQATPRAWGETGIASLFPGLDAGVVAPDTDYYAYTAEANEIGFFVYSIEGLGCGSGNISLHNATTELSNTFKNYYPNYRFPTAGTYYVRIRPNEATYVYYWGGFKGLADIHEMLYDPATIGRGTELRSGMNSAYTYAYLLTINGTNFSSKPDYSLTELDGRQFVFGPAIVNGLSVIRKFFVPTAAQGDTLGFMRIQDILTNSTAAPITVNVGVYSDLGANPSKVIASSTGDTLFTTADTWLWTDDKYPSASAPNLQHIFDGMGGADRVDSVSILGDDLYWEWRGVTLLPGATKIYLYYVAQDSLPANAQKKGPAFSATVLPATAKLGLGADARLVMNWPTEALVSVEPDEPVPMTYALNQNYPNPFNPTTVISYQLPAAGMVRLVVYDILGREVSVLVDESKEAGVHKLKFDASGLASGVYLCRMQVRPLDAAVGRDSKNGAGPYIDTKKFLLVR